ncbi:MAG: hypothetical protein WDO70_01485 [Alphaproteobacteria bacterium]
MAEQETPVNKPSGPEILAELLTDPGVVDSVRARSSKDQPHAYATAADLQNIEEAERRRHAAPNAVNQDAPVSPPPAAPVVAAAPPVTAAPAVQAAVQAAPQAEGVQADDVEAMADRILRRIRRNTREQREENEEEFDDLHKQLRKIRRELRNRSSNDEDEEAGNQRPSVIQPPAGTAQAQPTSQQAADVAEHWGHFGTLKLIDPVAGLYHIPHRDGGHMAVQHNHIAYHGSAGTDIDLIENGALHAQKFWGSLQFAPDSTEEFKIKMYGAALAHGVPVTGYQPEGGALQMAQQYAEYFAQRRQPGQNPAEPDMAGLNGVQNAAPGTAPLGTPPLGTPAPGNGAPVTQAQERQAFAEALAAAGSPYEEAKAEAWSNLVEQIPDARYRVAAGMEAMMQRPSEEAFLNFFGGELILDNVKHIQNDDAFIRRALDVVVAYGNDGQKADAAQDLAVLAAALPSNTPATPEQINDALLKARASERAGNADLHQGDVAVLVQLTDSLPSPLDRMKEYERALVSSPRGSLLNTVAGSKILDNLDQAAPGLSLDEQLDIVNLVRQHTRLGSYVQNEASDRMEALMAQAAKADPAAQIGMALGDALAAQAAGDNNAYGLKVNAWSDLIQTLPEASQRVAAYQAGMADPRADDQLKALAGHMIMDDVKNLPGPQEQREAVDFVAAHAAPGSELKARAELAQQKLTEPEIEVRTDAFIGVDVTPLDPVAIALAALNKDGNVGPLPIVTIGEAPPPPPSVPQNDPLPPGSGSSTGGGSSPDGGGFAASSFDAAPHNDAEIAPVDQKAVVADLAALAKSAPPRSEEEKTLAAQWFDESLKLPYSEQLDAARQALSDKSSTAGKSPTILSSFLQEEAVEQIISLGRVVNIDPAQRAQDLQSATLSTTVNSPQEKKAFEAWKQEVASMPDVVQQLDATLAMDTATKGGARNHLSKQAEAEHERYLAVFVDDDVDSAPSSSVASAPPAPSSKPASAPSAPIHDTLPPPSAPDTVRDGVAAKGSNGAEPPPMTPRATPPSSPVAGDMAGVDQLIDATAVSTFEDTGPPTEPSARRPDAGATASSRSVDVQTVQVAQAAKPEMTAEMAIESIEAENRPLLIANIKTGADVEVSLALARGGRSLEHLNDKERQVLVALTKREMALDKSDATKVLKSPWEELAQAAANAGKPDAALPSSSPTSPRNYEALKIPSSSQPPDSRPSASPDNGRDLSGVPTPRAEQPSPGSGAPGASPAATAAPRRRAPVVGTTP